MNNNECSEGFDCKLRRDGSSGVCKVPREEGDQERRPEPVPVNNPGQQSQPGGY